jgi:hypothetical protein
MLLRTPLLQNVFLYWQPTLFTFFTLLEPLETLKASFETTAAMPWH